MGHFRRFPGLPFDVVSVLCMYDIGDSLGKSLTLSLKVHTIRGNEAMPGV